MAASQMTFILLLFIVSPVMSTPPTVYVLAYEFPECDTLMYYYMNDGFDFTCYAYNESGVPFSYITDCVNGNVICSYYNGSHTCSGTPSYIINESSCSTLGSDIYTCGNAPYVPSGIVQVSFYDDLYCQTQVSQVFYVVVGQCVTIQRVLQPSSAAVWSCSGGSATNTSYGYGSLQCTGGTTVTPYVDCVNGARATCVSQPPQSPNTGDTLLSVSVSKLACLFVFVWVGIVASTEHP